MITTPNLMRELRATTDKATARDIPKHTWMDLYADLYRQCFGEDQSAELILADAVKRIATLKANGLL